MDPSAFPDREKEDPYHFIAYVPVSGVLYELDGLRDSPVMHAALEDDGEWLEKARDTIEKRIATYPPGAVGDLCCDIDKEELTEDRSCSIYWLFEVLLYLD